MVLRSNKTLTYNCVCHECGIYLTPLGIKMHKGSEKCKINVKARPLIKVVKAEQTRMERCGKVPVVKNVANAIINRKIKTICGLEVASTKLIHSDIECYVLEEYWVHDWVFKIWSKYNKIGYTRKAYTFFEKLNTLRKDDRDAEIGLILLDMYA